VLGLLAAGLVMAARGDFRPKPEPARTSPGSSEPRLVPAGVVAGL